MQNLKLQAQAVRKVNAGTQLLLEEDIQGQYEEGWASVNGLPAYFSPQNKGIGWIVDGQDYQALFELAKAKRQSFYHDDLTTAFRVFNQDGDGFGGMTVDIYNDYAVFSWYNPFIYTLKAEIIAGFQAAFPEVLGAYEKIRFKGLDFESQHIYGDQAPETFEVLENGVKYVVFMNDGLMTGIFLDQHDVRASLVDGLAVGKTLLNTFSYTAAFSVAAAMGGASATTSVDLAKRSRELSEAHFQANGLDLADHQFVVMDIFDYFKYAKRHDLKFDVVVLDPPSFARNKKQTFSVAKDYWKLIDWSRQLLNPGGIIIASTNAQNLTMAQFEKQLDKGMGEQNYRFTQTYRLPADFTTRDAFGNYLKVKVMQL
jgi:23S rRNA (cytosine1962-C5)-methyltransferase